MGGVHVEEALQLLGGSATRYLPFAGAPSGHPTRLGGSAPEVEAQCRSFAETRLRGRRHSCLSRDRGRAARPRRRLPARISQLRHGRGRGKHQFRRARRRRSRRRRGRLHHRHRGDRGLPTHPAPDRCRRSSGGARRLRRGGVSDRRCFRPPARFTESASARPAPAPRRRTRPASSLSSSAWRISSCWLFGAMPPFGGIAIEVGREGIALG